MNVNVLGTEYSIYHKSIQEDSLLQDCDGYCDKTSKKIVIATKSDDNELENWDSYHNKVLRHEIIHAFMFESGLAENWEHKAIGQEETTIDWFACQFPKILKIFNELGCVD